MEALWKLEDEWNLSTHKVIAIFACTSLLIGIFVAAAAAWLRRRRESVHQEPCRETTAEAERESRRGEEREREAASTPVVVVKSHNSTAAVWQRPILMGEKCELPRFSGLILYDQSGIPLPQCDQQGIVYTQEMMPTQVVRTTLRDLL